MKENSNESRARQAAGILYGELLLGRPIAKTMLRASVDVAAVSLLCITVDSILSHFFLLSDCQWVPLFHKTSTLLIECYTDYSLATLVRSFFFVGTVLFGSYLSTRLSMHSRFRHSALVTIGVLCIITVDGILSSAGITSILFYNTLAFFHMFFGYRIYFLIKAKEHL